MSPAITQHLTECFSPLLAYVLAFRESVNAKQPAYDDVRKDVLELLKQSETFVANGLCLAEDYAQARYAVCAWVDESILASAWTAKGRWRPELLQRVYYQSADAGEKFFERLKNLEPYQQAVREVYFLCLTLGFKGRYCAPDDGYALDQLKERHLKLLFNSVSEAPTLAAMEKNKLFPESYSQQPMTSLKKNNRRPWGWISALAGPAVVFIVLFLTYRFALYAVGENILKLVRS